VADDFRVAGGYVEVVARVNERTGRDAAERVTRDVERELASEAPAFEGAGGRAGTAMGGGIGKGVEGEVEKTLTRTRKRFEDEGDGSSKGFLDGFGKGFSGGFLSTLTLGFKGAGWKEAFSASPAVASVGLALAAAVVAVAAPAIGAGIVAALGVGSGLGVILAGAILAFKRDPALKAAGADLGKTIMGVDTGPLQDAYEAAQVKLTAALASHSASRIAIARKEAADTKKALIDAQNFNENNASLPDLARGAFAVPLTAAVGQLKRAFIELTPSIKQAFDSVAPFIGPLTDGFIGLVKNALPGFLDFLKTSGPSLLVFAQKLPEIGTALTKMFDAFGKGGPGAAKFLGDFINWLNFMIVYLSGLISWLSQGYLAIRNFLTSIPGWTKAAWEWLQKLWGQITGFFAGIWKSITSSTSKGADETVKWFSALPGRVGRAIARIPGILRDTLMDGARGMAFAAGYAVGQWLNWMAQLGPRTWAVLSAIPGLLGDLFTWAWQTGLAVIKYQINLTVSEVKALPRLMSGALSGLGHLLGSIWDAAWGAAVGAVKYQIGVIVWEVKKLPGMLWNLGGDIISGLINGITGYYGRLWSLAVDLGKHFLSGFKSVFGIHSPSRVMDEEIGQQGIGAGLIQGLDKSRGKVGGAAGKLADAAMGPFGGIDAKPGATAPAGASGPAGANGSYGPYVIELDGRQLAAFVIDAVTGAPKEVSRAVDVGRSAGGGHFPNTARRRL
jgi:hypothetical protein